jgi:hypothetical protein
MLPGSLNSSEAVLLKKPKESGCWCLMSAILATQEVETGGLQFKTSPNEMKARSYFKNT